MLQGFEAAPVYALLLERSNHALDHAVLLRAVRRDDLLAQSVTAHQHRAINACSNAFDAVQASPLRAKNATQAVRAYDRRSPAPASPDRNGPPRHGTYRSTTVRSALWLPTTWFGFVAASQSVVCGPASPSVGRSAARCSC
jgi:hypothetical protein